MRFKRWRAIDAIGFKDFQLNFDRRGIEDYFEKRPDIRVIGLSRIDPVRRHLSRAMLQQTGQAVARAGEKAEFQKLVLDVDQFINGVIAVAKENVRLEEMLSRIQPTRRLLIDYDEYFSDGENMSKINDEMFKFLSLAPIPAAGEHGKLNSRSLRDTIENYDDIATAARAAGFERYMNDPAN